MIRKLIMPVALFLVLSMLFTGCEVTRQAKLASNLANCDFRIRSVEKVNLAGVELQDVKSVSDLGISEMAQIMAGFASPILPLSLQLNLEGRNPNATDAGLNRLEWILFIDEIQMASGILDKPFTIPALGTTNIPVDVGLDLKPVLSGKSGTIMLNFCMNLAGVGNTPTRFRIKLRPTIMVAGRALKYPGYITVNTTYSGK